MANTSVEFNVINDGSLFGKYNDLDIVYVSGLASKCSKANAQRLINANKKQADDCPSIFGCATLEQLNKMILERLQSLSIVPEKQRLKVVSVETAKAENMERINEKFPVMNEQVVANSLSRDNSIQFVPASSKDNVLNLRRSA